MCPLSKEEINIKSKIWRVIYYVYGAGFIFLFVYTTVALFTQRLFFYPPVGYALLLLYVAVTLIGFFADLLCWIFSKEK